MGRPPRRDLRDIKACRAPKDSKALKEFRVTKVRRAPKVIRAPKDSKALKVIKDRRGHKV